MIRRSIRKLGAVFSCLLVAALVGCGSHVLVTAKAGSDDLSGTYRFAGIRHARPENFPNPLIDWGDVALDSEVRLEQTDGALVARYTNGTGRTMQRQISLRDEPGVTFESGEPKFRQEVPLVDAPMLPGRAKQFAGTRFLKDEDGNLSVIGFFTERGWMFHLIPFTDHHEYDLVPEAVER